MKILFIGSLAGNVTGQSLACRVFLDELQKNHEVMIVDLAKKEFKQGVSSFMRVVEIAGILLQVLRFRGRADLVYFTISESVAGNLKDLLVYLLCFDKLGSMIIHLHGGAGMRVIMGRPSGLIRRLNAFFLRRMGGVIVLGERHVPLYRGIVPPEGIFIVPNFAEDYLFAAEDRIAARFARQGPLRVLFLSNLLPGKGYLELLSAYEGLDEATRASIAIDFAGGFEADDQKEAFERRIAGLPQVRYHGMVRGAAKEALFHGAHVFCLPTYYPYEGQPISILEAYASGCVVITTDHSGIGDIFTDGVNGYEVEKASPASLSEHLREILRERDRLPGIAAHNRSAAERLYRTSRYNARMMEVLSTVASRRGRA